MKKLLAAIMAATTLAMELQGQSLVFEGGEGIANTQIIAWTFSILILALWGWSITKRRNNLVVELLGCVFFTAFGLGIGAWIATFMSHNGFTFRSPWGLLRQTDFFFTDKSYISLTNIAHFKAFMTRDCLAAALLVWGGGF